MDGSCYDALSGVYDKLNSNVDYGDLADFVETCFEEYGSGEVRRVLDLGCGSGPLTTELSMLGYDVTGIDISEGMLDAARERAKKLGLGNVSFKNGDMRHFKTPKKYDAAVCTMDGINHLLALSDVAECFRSVRGALRKGGLFLFDVNTPYKIREIYGGNTFVIEEDGAVCVWRNRTDVRRCVTAFSVSVFEKTDGGLWSRRDGMTKERGYSLRTLKTALAEASLLPLAVFGDCDLTAPAEDAERWYLLARAV